MQLSAEQKPTMTVAKLGANPEYLYNLLFGSDGPLDFSALPPKDQQIIAGNPAEIFTNKAVQAQFNAFWKKQTKVINTENLQIMDAEATKQPEFGPRVNPDSLMRIQLPDNSTLFIHPIMAATLFFTQNLPPNILDGLGRLNVSLDLVQGLKREFISKYVPLALTTAESPTVKIREFTEEEAARFKLLEQIKLLDAGETHHPEVRALFAEDGLLEEFVLTEENVAIINENISDLAELETTERGHLPAREYAEILVGILDGYKLVGKEGEINDTTTLIKSLTEVIELNDLEDGLVITSLEPKKEREHRDPEEEEEEVVVADLDDEDLSPTLTVTGTIQLTDLLKPVDSAMTDYATATNVKSNSRQPNKEKLFDDASSHDKFTHSAGGILRVLTKSNKTLLASPGVTANGSLSRGEKNALDSQLFKLKNLQKFIDDRKESVEKTEKVLTELEKNTKNLTGKNGYINDEGELHRKAVYLYEKFSTYGRSKERDNILELYKGIRDESTSADVRLENARTIIKQYAEFRLAAIKQNLNGIPNNSENIGLNKLSKNLQAEINKIEGLTKASTIVMKVPANQEAVTNSIIPKTNSGKIEIPTTNGAAKQTQHKWNLKSSPQYSMIVENQNARLTLYPKTYKVDQTGKAVGESSYSNESLFEAGVKMMDVALDNRPRGIHQVTGDSEFVRGAILTAVKIKGVEWAKDHIEYNSNAVSIDWDGLKNNSGWKIRGKSDTARLEDIDNYLHNGKSRQTVREANKELDDLLETESPTTPMGMSAGGG